MINANMDWLDLTINVNQFMLFLVMLIYFQQNKRITREWYYRVRCFDWNILVLNPNAEFRCLKVQWKEWLCLLM